MPNQTAPVRQLGTIEEPVEELPVVTLKGVEILSEGGPYFGTGSPPEGDYFDAEFIRELAAETALLVDTYGEWKAPGKIGHSAAQKLLAESGLASDELPALGFLANVRSAAVDGVEKIVADMVNVPRSFAALVKAQAYRTRSAEIGRVTSQVDGKKHTIVTALSWLGATAPAVRTLADVVALYADAQLDRPAWFDQADAEVVLALAEASDDPELVERRLAEWTEEGSYRGREEKVSEALRALYPNQDGGPWAWVRDCSDAKVLLTVERPGSGCETYVAAYTVDDTGAAALQPESEWTPVEEQWVEAPREMSYVAPFGVPFTITTTSGNASGTRTFTVAATNDAEIVWQLEQPADTSRHEGDAVDHDHDQEERAMPRLTTYSDEQIRSLADTLGVEAEDGKLRDAVADKLAGDLKVEAAPAVEPAAAQEGVVTLSAEEHAELRAGAELARSLAEERRVEKREAVIGRALSEGRIDPAKADQWRSDFDASPAVVERTLSEMPVRDEFARAFGADGDGDGDDAAASEDEAYRRYAAATGIRVEA